MDAAIKRPFIEASTDAMRVLIDGQRMLLPYDTEIIGELQAAPQSIRNSGSLDPYGRSSGRKSGLHTLDAMRMACFTYSSSFIDKMIAEHKNIWSPPPIVFI